MNKASILALTRNKSVQIGVATVLSAAAGWTGSFYFNKMRLRAYYEEISNREIQEAKSFYTLLNKSGPDNDSPEKVLERLHGSDAVEALKTYKGHPVEAPVFTEEELQVEEAPPVTVVNNIFIKDGVPDNEAFDYDAEVAQRSTDAPYIISHDEYYQNETDYDQATLTYFEGDDVVADDRDQPLPDPEVTVGDENLARFGHGSKDNNIVYVRNDELEVDFEILRSNGKYAKEVLGFDEDQLQHSDNSGVHRFRKYHE